MRQRTSGTTKKKPTAQSDEWMAGALFSSGDVSTSTLRESPAEPVELSISVPQLMLLASGVELSDVRDLAVGSPMRARRSVRGCSPSLKWERSLHYFTAPGGSGFVYSSLVCHLSRERIPLLAEQAPCSWVIFLLWHLASLSLTDVTVD